VAVDADAGDTPDAAVEALEAAAAAIGDAGFDPDDDAETITALVEAADALMSALDDAEVWDTSPSGRR
jgi:hypothetical protein